MPRRPSAASRCAPRHSDFLETGVSPFQVDRVAKGGADASRRFRLAASAARLSRPAVAYRGRSATAPRGPHYDVLLDMAIAAKQPDEVLRWYDKMAKGERRFGGGWVLQGAEPMIAWPPPSPSRIPNGPWKSIGGSWMRALPQADVSAYESAAGYLKKMQPIMKSLGRQAEWANLAGRDSGKIPQPPAIHGDPRQARRPHDSPEPQGPAAADDKGHSTEPQAQAVVPASPAVSPWTRSGRSARAGNRVASLPCRTGPVSAALPRRPASL